MGGGVNVNGGKLEAHENNTPHIPTLMLSHHYMRVTRNIANFPIDCPPIQKNKVKIHTTILVLNILPKSTCK
jgi:hypothetical protein